jgi:hypothetical protein
MPITVARLVSTTSLKSAWISYKPGRSVLLNTIPWLTGAGLTLIIASLPE